MNTPEAIRSLVTQNLLGQAIKELYPLQSSRSRRNTLSLLESRLNDLNEKMRVGVVTEEAANVELNRLRKDILEVVDLTFAEEEIPATEKRRKAVLLGILGGVALVLIGFFMFDKEKPLVCDNYGLSVKVADFQNQSQENQTDAFANSVVVRLDKTLVGEDYDVLPVGAQTRKMADYHDEIVSQHFLNTCDTMGVFVNGFLDTNNEIFNTYLTLANLRFSLPELAEYGNDLVLDTPEGMSFSVRENANFLADFVLAIIWAFEGRTLEALEIFTQLQKEEAELIADDADLTANIAFFKGSCYAMRGDDDLAKSQYKVAREEGNSELRLAATKNTVAAGRINRTMEGNPELSKRLAENRREHSSFEKDLIKVLEEIGGGFDRAAREIFGPK